jgi:hypothetical protein
MAGNAMNTRSRQIFAPVCGFFFGGLAHSVLPRGMFGQYDMVLRASAVGAIACTAALVCLIFLQSRDRKP